MNGCKNWRFWAWPSELKRRGVLGINARNADFLLRLNPRALYPRVDDKALTKQICESGGIPVPETYAIIDRFGDVRKLPDLLDNRQEFVVKPARGAGGRGILVIVRRTGEEFVTATGGVLSFRDMRYHVSTILSGMYSLGGRPDRVIVEERVARHPLFESLAIGGTPDIRVLLYRSNPVMAMLRLPTVASRGRANLHQGAVGVGIHIDTGRTYGGVCRGRMITCHPDTRAPIEDIPIPCWKEVIASAVGLGRMIGMRYVGVDIILDANRGPVVLEANARPGLAIQIANRDGLWSHLEADHFSA